MSSVSVAASLPVPPFARRKNGLLERWVCSRCGYVYDGHAGEPRSQIPPDTAFETLPASWHCPHCAAEKRYFFL
ncbi:MAG: rubredoxin [Uliginosibacterium sp.]|jgi:rubredoxin|nr:rubredoxin [Uliginosibacterium sp.]MBK9614240.1 rubredoxin [Uliginosibacterium sp.]